MLERFFQLTANRTNIKTEAIGGLTTFLTMAYIIIVNPSVLTETGMDKNALIIVTCLIVEISTLMMGLIPKVPIAVAPGMGLNAFFAYTIVIGNGIPWQTALGCPLQFEKQRCARRRSQICRGKECPHSGESGGVFCKSSRHRYALHPR